MSKHAAAREEDSPAKKQKTLSDTAAAVEEHSKELEQITLLQDQIEKLNADADEEKLKIEKKYDEKKKPHLRKRNEFCSKIPAFWLKCFEGHNILSQVVNPMDKESLAHLQDIWVEDAEDITSGFKITFKFGKGASKFFENETLWKAYKAGPEGVVVTSSPIKWKAGHNLVENLKKAGDASFYQWFEETDEEDELATIIREEIWGDPLNFYGVDPDIGDEDEEEEEDDEDQGEEEAEEADE